MGLLTVKGGNTTYKIELEEHSTTKPELPVEQLQAIMIEAADARIYDKKFLLSTLNERKLDGKVQEIVERAKRSGAEIWFGDIPVETTQKVADASLLIGITAGVAAGSGLAASRITRRKFLQQTAVLLGGVASTRVPVKAGDRLAEPGDANERKISRTISTKYGNISPVIETRNQILGHKLITLTKITRHKKVGLLVGAQHIGIADILERNKPLTPGERSELANASPHALKMIRCRYNKEKQKWEAEQHLL